MDKFLVDRIQITVDNYRLAKEELRNDGDIINHFASLVFSHYEKEILVERVKEIRKDIKLNTPRISPFRGDTLNILSLLIATVDNEKQEQLIQDMYDTMEILEEEGFLSGSYLALTAFTISKYAQLKDKRYIISKIKELFIILKELRMEISREEKIPPYMVFGDSTLKELSNRMPITDEQFLDISGVGNSKLNKYGDKFMAKIKEYIEEKNIEVNWSFNRTKSTNISFDEVLENDDNKKYSKTKEEGEKRKSHDITVDYIKLGKSLKEIAKERNLALTTIMGHVQQYISEGNEINFKINLEEFFDNDEEKIILKAIDEVGYNKLKDIKEIVPSEITYDAIRAVVLKKVIREVTKNIVK